jgi:hypothetical protein
MVATVYVSSQCPNCARFLEQLEWLQSAHLKIPIRTVNIDGQRVDNLTAVPTVVDGKDVHVGTRAFEWLQAFDAQVPLSAYADFSKDAEDDELPFTIL